MPRAPLDMLEAAAVAHRAHREETGMKEGLPSSRGKQAQQQACREICTRGFCRNMLYCIQNSVTPAITWTASSKSCK